MARENKEVLYEFCPSAQVGVFIRVNTGQFESSFEKLLESLHFKPSSKVESTGIELKIKLASPAVARQIGMESDLDQYGHENISKQSKFLVYRFKGHGLLVYSHNSTSWELGVLPSFGADTSIAFAKMILNRFLGLALAPKGILGIWGQMPGQELIVERPLKSGGEAIYLDVVNAKLCGLEKAGPIDAKFKFVRLDATLGDQSKLMGAEELFSFLAQHVTYFDYLGPSVPVRQMLHTLAKNYHGLWRGPISLKSQKILTSIEKTL